MTSTEPGARGRRLRAIAFVATALVLLLLAGISVLQLYTETESSPQGVVEIRLFPRAEHPPMVVDASLTFRSPGGHDEVWRFHAAVSPPDRLRLVVYAVEPFTECTGFLGPPAGTAVVVGPEGVLLADLIGDEFLQRGWDGLSPTPSPLRDMFGGISHESRMDAMSLLGLSARPVHGRGGERQDVVREGRRYEASTYRVDPPIRRWGYELKTVVVYTDPQWDAPVRWEFLGPDDRIAGVEEIRGLRREADGSLFHEESVSEWGAGRIDVAQDVQVAWSKGEPRQPEEWTASLPFAEAGRRILRKFARTPWGVPFPTHVYVESLEADRVLEIAFGTPLRLSDMPNSWFSREGLVEGLDRPSSPHGIVFLAALAGRRQGLRAALKEYAGVPGPYRRSAEHFSLLARADDEAGDPTFIQECIDHLSDPRVHDRAEGGSFVMRLIERGALQPAMHLAETLGGQISGRYDAKSLLEEGRARLKRGSLPLEFAFAARRLARDRQDLRHELEYVAGMLFEWSGSFVAMTLHRGDWSAVKPFWESAADAYRATLDAPRGDPFRFLGACSLADLLFVEDGPAPLEEGIPRADRATIDIGEGLRRFREAARDRPTVPGAKFLNTAGDACPIDGLDETVLKEFVRRWEGLVEQLDDDSPERVDRLVAEAATLLAGVKLAAVRPRMPEVVSELIQRQIQAYGDRGRAFLARWTLPEEEVPRKIMQDRWNGAVQFLIQSSRDPLCPYLKEPLIESAMDQSAATEWAHFPDIGVGRLGSVWEKWYPPSAQTVRTEGIVPVGSIVATSAATGEWVPETPQQWLAYQERARSAMERSADEAIEFWMGEALAYGHRRLRPGSADATIWLELRSDGHGGWSFLSR